MRVVQGRPLGDLTDTLNRPQVVETEAVNASPEAAVVVEPADAGPEGAIVVVVEPADAGPGEVVHINVDCEEAYETKAPVEVVERTSYLRELFGESQGSELRTLSAKVERLLENQQAVFSVLARVLGELADIKAQGSRVGCTCSKGREQGGDVRLGGDVHVNSSLGWVEGEVNLGWVQEGGREPLDSPSTEIASQFQSTLDDSILSPQPDGGGMGGIFFWRKQ